MLGKWKSHVSLKHEVIIWCWNMNFSLKMEKWCASIKSTACKTLSFYVQNVDVKFYNQSMFKMLMSKFPVILFSKGWYHNFLPCYVHKAVARRLLLRFAFPFQGDILQIAGRWAQWAKSCLRLDWRASWFGKTKLKKTHSENLNSPVKEESRGPTHALQ